jgi:hypothetical protein
LAESGLRSSEGCWREPSASGSLNFHYRQKRGVVVYRKALIGSALAILCSSPHAATANVSDLDRSDHASKVVCREIVPVGSIVDRQMICMSKAAWNKNRADRKDADDFSGEFLKLKQPAQPEMMQLGRADWEKLPKLTAKGKVPYLQLVRQTRDLLRKGECSLPGQSPKKFDIAVNYGVKFDAGGKLSRVLVEDSRCSTLNAMIGLVVLARAERGDFNAAASSSTGWFADKINLTLQ